MLIGHYAAALAARRVAARPSPGWFVAACQLPDLRWPLVVLAGLGRTLAPVAEAPASAGRR